MNIQEVQENDEAGVYALVCELEQRALDHVIFSEIFAMQRKDPTCMAWVLKEQDTILAYASVRVVYHLHHCDKVAMLEELIVTAPCRRKGYGHLLFQQVSCYAKQQGCVQLELSSSQTRTQAHAFYESEGMQCRHLKYTMIL